jgi:hypothetical protein
MPATIVVRIMIRWIIGTATFHRAQRARSTITSAVIVRIMICEIICAATAIMELCMPPNEPDPRLIEPRLRPNDLPPPEP